MDIMFEFHQAGKRTKGTTILSSFHSIHLQAICLYDHKFTDIFVELVRNTKNIWSTILKYSFIQDKKHCSFLYFNQKSKELCKIHMKQLVASHTLVSVNHFLVSVTAIKYCSFLLIRWPGRTYDAQVWNMSPLCKDLRICMNYVSFTIKELL